MSYLTLEQLQKEMKAKNISWKSEENEISKTLKSPASGNLFGLNISTEEIKTMMTESKKDEPKSFSVSLPPPRFDWRNEGGKNWMTPVKNQGNCGACVSFATVAALETRSRINQNDPTLNINLSEAHLFFCGAGFACGTGWNFDPAMSQCMNVGVGAESQFPYHPHDQPCHQIRPVVKVTSYDREMSRIARMQAIASNGPVIAGMRVFEDFYYYRGGVYRHVSGLQRGLHAVCVVGYNEAEQYWIVKNSWGTQWGDKGYFYIGFGECDLDQSFPFYDPEVQFLGGNPIS